MLSHLSDAILLCSHVGKKTEDGFTIEALKFGIGPIFSIKLNNGAPIRMEWSKSKIKNDEIRIRDGRHFMAIQRRARIDKLQGEPFSHLDKCAIALSQLGQEFEYQKLKKTLTLEKIEITKEKINHFLVDRDDASKSMSIISEIENCNFSHISEGDQMFSTTLLRKWDS